MYNLCLPAALVRLQPLLRAASTHDLRISLRQLTPVYSLNHGLDYRPVLKEIKNNRESRIILHCDFDTIGTVLHQVRAPFRQPGRPAAYALA